LNSGDIYYKDALLTVSKYFLKKRIDFLFGSVQKTKIYHGFEPEKIFYRMNIYPSHSCSFFIKRKAQMKIGYYDTNFNWCSDLDLFYRMIVKYKLKGVATKREEVIGKFDMRGISSKISKIAFYYYEMKVRYKNGQNFFYLLILFNLKVLNLIRNFLIFR